MKKIVLVTGGFDPLHSGHISYLNAAKLLGNLLIVGVNSDEWLERKKGRSFMSFFERLEIVRNLRCVDQVIAFNDDDNSACDAIKCVQESYPDYQIVFANGGDRTNDNIPEMRMIGVEFAFGVGGQNKLNSSSWILEEWKAPKTERPWGYYRVLHEAQGMKVKELTVNPGQSLSMQRHSHRAEYWIVEEGNATVNSLGINGFQFPPRLLVTHEEVKISVNEWHQLSNPFDQPCKIVEIQYGTICEETDIERQ